MDDEKRCEICGALREGSLKNDEEHEWKPASDLIWCTGGHWYAEFINAKYVMHPDRKAAIIEQVLNDSFTQNLEAYNAQFRRSFDDGLFAKLQESFLLEFVPADERT